MENLALDFAELAPFSVKARNALTKQIQHLQRYPNEYLSAFLREKSDKSDTESDEEFSLTNCAFILSFGNIPRHGHHRGWRIGTGSLLRQLDLVIAPLKQREEMATFHLHPRSGFLMLESLHPDVMVKRDSVFHRAYKVCLPHVENMIRFGNLEYCLKYIVNDNESFIHHRNLLLGSDKVIVNSGLDAFPMARHSSVGNCMVHRTFAYGGFGWVSAGVNKISGEPVAIKELPIKRGTSSDDATREAHFNLQFKTKTHGILQTEEVVCEHGNQLPCGIVPEKYFIITRLGCSDFSNTDWSAYTYEQRLAIYLDTLRGLCELHQAGLIHRDITTKNLLIMSTVPTYAVISDFGKMIQAVSSTDKCIGPPKTCAPEVWHSEYGNAVDIWSLAYAWLDTFSMAIPTPEMVDQEAYAEIFEKIEHLQETNSICQDFGNLLMRMLCWNAEYRITAPQALESKVWTKAASPSDDERESARISQSDQKRASRQRQADHTNREAQVRLTNGISRRFHMSHTATRRRRRTSHS